MNSVQDNGEGNEVLASPKSKSALWQFLNVLLKWKWFLLLSFTSIMVVVTVIVLLIPRWYRAEAAVLPPKNSNILGGLSNITSIMQSVSPLLSRSGFGSSTSTYTFLAILNSRSVMDSMINKFNLVKVYHITHYPMESAERELRDNTLFDIDENDALTITVMDRDANRSASMANYFVTLLNEIFTKVSVEEAHNNKLFVQQRYEKNLADLKASEDTLEEFQQRYKVYDMPQQAKAAITAGADLEAQRISAEVELGVMRQQYGEDAPQVRLKSLQIQELNKKLGDMQTGAGSDFGKGASVLPAFKNVPELGIAYLRLYRDYQIQTKLLEFILPLYEQAKIEEQGYPPLSLFWITQFPLNVPPFRKECSWKLFLALLLSHS